MAVRKTKVSKTIDTTWKYSAKSSDDKATATLVYKDDFDGWASRCPYFGDPHPDLAGMKLVGIDAEREAGDQIKVTLSYETSSSSADYPGRKAGEATARYSARIAGGEEHILTSAYAEPLSETERKALLEISNGNEEDKTGKDYADSVTSELGLAVLAKIRKGFIAYKTGGLVYVEKTTIDSLSALNYSKLGKIDTPPGPAGGDSNSWLYVSASAEPSDDGEYWNCERQWEFSPNGWDEDVYSAT